MYKSMIYIQFSVYKNMFKWHDVKTFNENLPTGSGYRGQGEEGGDKLQ